MTWLDWLAATLALWRVSSLFSATNDERGPFDVFIKLRKRAGVIYDDDDKLAGYDESRYSAGLLHCLWCFSLVAALPLGALWLLWPDAARCVSLPLALSAGAIIAQRWINGKS